MNAKKRPETTPTNAGNEALLAAVADERKHAGFVRDLQARLDGIDNSVIENMRQLEKLNTNDLTAAIRAGDEAKSKSVEAMVDDFEKSNRSLAKRREIIMIDLREAMEHHEAARLRFVAARDVSAFDEAKKRFHTDVTPCIIALAAALRAWFIWCLDHQFDALNNLYLICGWPLEKVSFLLAIPRMFADLDDRYTPGSKGKPPIEREELPDTEFYLWNYDHFQYDLRKKNDPDQEPAGPIFWTDEQIKDQLSENDLYMAKRGKSVDVRFNAPDGVRLFSSKDILDVKESVGGCAFVQITSLHDGNRRYAGKEFVETKITTRYEIVMAILNKIGWSQQVNK